MANEQPFGPQSDDEAFEDQHEHETRYASDRPTPTIPPTYSSSSTSMNNDDDNSTTGPFNEQLGALQHSRNPPRSGHPGGYSAPVAYSTRPDPQYSSSFQMDRMAAALPGHQIPSVQYRQPSPMLQVLQQQQHRHTQVNAGRQGQAFSQQSYPYSTNAQFQAMYPVESSAVTHQYEQYPAYQPQIYPPSTYYGSSQSHLDPSLYGQIPYANMPYSNPGAMGEIQYQGYPQRTMQQQNHPAMRNLNRSRTYNPNTASFPIPRQPLNTHQTFHNTTASGTLPAEFSRGPPRKPKQSGHALWVGNLSPRVTITDLKDYFSQDLTKDIESIKLISKSNCAFINYRTEAACIMAMNKFHDSRFLGTSLVCRPRKSVTSTIGLGSGSQSEAWHEQSPVSTGSVSGGNAGGDIHVERRSLPERFFVLKSLTLGDLELSTRTGVWSTQAHNEAALNDAFENAKVVYLLFSANKSGEYFGCARMISSITPIQTSAASTTAPQAMLPTATDTTSSATSTRTLSSALDDGPSTTLTPATQWAPSGRIIDDSARGTIFWEADSDNEESLQETEVAGTSGTGTTSPAESAPTTSTPITASSSSQHRDDAEATVPIPSGDTDDTSSTNQFKIEWLSTRRVPFYKTRSLRNPWNSNREVKIARDGTELETEVGRRIISLFGQPMARSS